MLPYIYTTYGAINSPHRTRTPAQGHEFDGRTLRLVAEKREDALFFQPVEWWREYAEGWDSSLENIRAVLLDRLLEKHTYAVKTSIAKQLVVVTAESAEQDGDRVLGLFTNGRVVAVFDNPASWGEQTPAKTDRR